MVPLRAFRTGRALPRHARAPRRADRPHIRFELFTTDADSRAQATRAAGRRARGDETVDDRVHARRAVVAGRAPGRANEAILNAALRVRADVPFACAGGVCGTCRARLIEGRRDDRELRARARRARARIHPHVPIPSDDRRASSSTTTSDEQSPHDRPHHRPTTSRHRARRSRRSSTRSTRRARRAGGRVRRGRGVRRACAACCAERAGRSAPGATSRASTRATTT